MIDQINQLIAINLQLFFNATQSNLSLRDFKDTAGNPIAGAKMLAEIMQQKELIKNYSDNEFSYELTELGKHIAEFGGWLIYVEKIKNQNTVDKSGKLKRKEINIELIIAGIIIAFLSGLIVSFI
jgi:hypothetical protein